MIHPENQLCSHELYKMPEFKALCDRLGIPWEFATTGITIKIGDYELVEVTHTYRVEDKHKPKSDVIETTNLHNQEYKTHKPCQHPN